MKSKLRLLLPLFGFLTLIACTSNDKQPTQENVQVADSLTNKVEQDTLEQTPEAELLPDTLPAPPHSDYDYAAAYLAGLLPDTALNPLAAISQHSAWLNYAQRTKIGWERMRRDRLDTMRLWSENTVNFYKKNATSTLFYPFSGPDFLHAHTFFPQAERYFLIGLEPVGEKPTLEKLQKDSTYRYLQQVSKALNNLMRGGYFITFDMREDFKIDKLNGVLPLIYVFMARTGQRIESVEYVGISKKGEWVNLPDNQRVDSIKVYGVQVKFWNAASKKQSELVYIEQDMANWSFKTTNGLYQYLQENLSTDCHTYLKSASYLMHTAPFSNIRQLTLEKTSLLLQDDTGIAYRFLDKSQWTVHLFGGYAKPIPPFTGLFERDLDSAYRDTVNKPIHLPFMLGYQWGKKGRTSMQCAVKN